MAKTVFLKTAREIIRHEYGTAPNIMTPDVIKVGMLRRFKEGYAVAFELALGLGMTGPIWGVSVVRAYPWGTRRIYKLSTCFRSRGSADDWILELKGVLVRG